MDRFRRYWRKWRGLQDAPLAGDEEASNFAVPLLKWNVYSKLADEVDKLLGNDAEIVAIPEGPSDERRAHKLSRFVSWRHFRSMRMVLPLTTFCFRKTLFGRAHALSTWVRRTYPAKQDGRIVRLTAYEGPGFVPLWPDDLIVPGEDAETFHDFSHGIRRYRVTPDQLRLGATEGRYNQAAVEGNWEKIVKLAREGRRREIQGEELHEEKDEAEGVIYDGGLSPGNSIVIHEWYGYWRMPTGRRDVGEMNLKGRAKYESQLVSRYMPDLDLLVGTQDLMDLYPRMEKRRPITEAALTRDGSYHSPGFGELLEDIEDEGTANHNLFTQAGELAVGPVLFYKPSSGFKADSFRYSPGMAIASEDPSGVKVMQMSANLEYPLAKEHQIFSYAERLTGQSDLSMGRGSDRPNAPKTYGGTVALIQKGNIRAALDTTVLREDMAQIVQHNFRLEQEFLPPKIFFRVTESEARGLFPIKQGGTEITPEELAGNYDFDLRFATSEWSREADKERAVQIYLADMQNPLIATNPRSLWLVTEKFHRAMGDRNFGDIVAEPPDMGLPKHPREEWTMALQGEELQINPADDDRAHLADHYRRIEEERASVNADEHAIELMAQHIPAHQRQQAQKVAMQAMVGAITDSLKQGGAGLNLGRQMPASLQQIQETIGELYAPEGEEEQPRAA
jgi:hypothetical protein